MGEPEDAVAIKRQPPDAPDESAQLQKNVFDEMLQCHHQYSAAPESEKIAFAATVAKGETEVRHEPWIRQETNRACTQHMQQIQSTTIKVLSQ